MRTIEIEYPETIPAVLNLSPEMFEQEARFGLAVKLYEMGRLTSGQAARLAGNSGRWGYKCRIGKLPEGTMDKSYDTFQAGRSFIGNFS